MIVYSDLQNEFMLLDYLRSHSQLLFRSKMNKNRDYNIDIIFKSVEHLLIPSRINGIEIALAQLEKQTNQMLIGKYLFRQDLGYKIFTLKNSDGQSYYINAGSFGVFHNKLELLETSIGRYDMGNLGENILWFAG